MQATYGEAFVDDLQIITSNEYNKLLLYDKLNLTKYYSGDPGIIRSSVSELE